MHDETKKMPSAENNEDAVIPEIVVIDIPEDTGTTKENEHTEDLRRWGFQHAIKNSNPGITADDLLAAHKEVLAKELERWENIYKSIQERYQTKIDGLEAEKEKIKTKAEASDPTLEDLKKRKDEVLAEMKELRKRILEVRQRMAVGKQDMMSKWMTEAQEQIDKAIILQKKVYTETRSINKQRYDDEKITLDKHIGHWIIKREDIRERQTEVHLQMKRIGADGVTPNTSYMLIGIGTSVAASAGYFFSVFTSTANFGNQDAFFFLLNGLLSVSGSSGSSFLTKLGLLIAFVFIIGLISFGCYKLLRHFFPGKGKTADDAFGIRSGAKIKKRNYEVSGELKAGSWFSFWLQIAPAVIIGGIIILLLALNDADLQDVSRLNSSIEGVLVGTAVALGIGGIMYLYIMKIIEPRLQRKQDQDKGWFNFLKYNWELSGCVLLFIVFTLAIIAYPVEKGSLGAHPTTAIAIPEFIVVSLLSAFPFAYGVRFKGLNDLSRFLQRETDRLDYAIAECSTPDMPDITVSYTEKMQDMIEDILSVVQNKALLLRGAGSNADLGEKSLREERPNAFLKKMQEMIRKLLFRKSHEQSPIHHLTALADWEKRYFPDLDEEIKVLAFEYKEYEQELKELNNQIDKIDAEASSDKEEGEKELKKLQVHIEKILGYMLNADRKKINHIMRLESDSVNSQAAILDGFHLGIWYRSNGIGPADDFYTILIPPVPVAPLAGSEASEVTTLKFLDNGDN